MTSSFPRWLERSQDINLREVAPDLYVGAELSPGVSPKRGVRWAAVVDLYGSSLEEPGREALYSKADCLLHWPFLDGNHFPLGALDAVARLVLAGRAKGPVLIHCQAGLSRSASAAYAMMRTQDHLSDVVAHARVKVPGEPSFPRRETLGSAQAWVLKNLLPKRK